MRVLEVRWHTIFSHNYFLLFFLALHLVLAEGGGTVPMMILLAFELNACSVTIFFNMGWQLKERQGRPS